jgi:hypothetical protein
LTLALWTPAPAASWARLLAARLATLELVTEEPHAPPAADLDLYHVAAAPAHGFVYRALLRRPGVLLLAEWNLHALVHAETAGLDDPSAYLREARHAHGDTGVFVARQVLAGLGGSLPRLLATNQRVLEHGLAIVAFTEELRARAAARVAGRPVAHLPLARLGGAAEATAGPGPAALAQDVVWRLRDLVERLAPRAEVERRRVADDTRAEASPFGWALDELRWSARELGLAEPPEDAAALAASLFGARA